MYNQKISEFEVQALAYWELKRHFPIVRGEYKVAKDKGSGQRGARLDIAIFNSNEEMKLIIEVKRANKGTTTRQSLRYAELTGVPCIYIRGLQDAENAVDIVNQYMRDHDLRIG